MSKKNFKTSFDSLLGEDDHTPKKNTSSEKRATFLVKLEQLEKLKTIAYHDRRLLKEVLEDSLDNYFSTYEYKNGSIEDKKKPNK